MASYTVIYFIVKILEFHDGQRVKVLMNPYQSKDEAEADLQILHKQEEALTACHLVQVGANNEGKDTGMTARDFAGGLGIKVVEHRIMERRVKDAALIQPAPHGRIIVPPHRQH